jgi:hypothetical protein
VSAAAPLARPRAESSRSSRAADSSAHAPRYIQDGPTGPHIAVLRRHLICYLCGASVGFLDTLAGAPHVVRLRRADGCQQPLPVHGRLPRCCFCGGSLYFDEAETITFWPKVAIGHEKPGRKPRALRELADADVDAAR